jgi:hypothetical protein
MIEACREKFRSQMRLSDPSFLRVMQMGMRVSSASSRLPYNQSHMPMYM